MAEAQGHFPISGEGRIKDRIANAPLPIPTLYEDLIEEGDEIEAKLQLRNTKIARLGDEREALSHQIHMAEKEEKNTGREYYSESTNLDANGGETITRKATGYIEKLKAKLKAIKDERNTLLGTKSRRNWRSFVDDELAAKTAPLIPFDPPIDWSPGDGEQFAEGYIREFGGLNTIRDKVKAVWNAPLTLAEATASVDAEIDALASKAPSYGGHIRGSSVADRGGLQIGNPGKMIGFVETRINAETTAIHPVHLLAFFFRDQMKKVSREYMQATYSDEGAISAAEKAVLIPKLEAELWQQRRVVEAAYRACRAAGIRNLNRPKDTPVEILLDVVPFSKARLMRVESPARTMPNPDAGMVPANDIDFEGDADE